jgi:hypothetical protein
MNARARSGAYAASSLLLVARSRKPTAMVTLGPAAGCTLPRRRHQEADMAHAKDKGASKNVKKKAQKSVKEKRAEKKLKKETRDRATYE